MSDRSERVLVLGAGGFVGNGIVATLAQQGYRVSAFARSHAGRTSANVTAIRGSIEDTALLHEAVSQSTTIVYSASLSTPGSSANDPALEVIGNLLPIARVLECASAFPERHFIYLSSGGTVYGDGADKAIESTPLRPRSYYGAGKVAAESLIHACAETTDWRATILRPTNVYGPGQATARAFAVVPTLFERALDGQPFLVWGDGESVRDYCYLDDVASAVQAAVIAPPERGCAIYNVASGFTASVTALISACEQACGRAIAVEFRDPRGVDVRHVAPDASAIASALGWTAQVSLEDGLDRTWRWIHDRRSAGASG